MMNKKLNGITKKGLSVGLCAALLISQGMTAFATGKEVAKDENVFVILNEDGTVEKQIVSDWLHSDSGLSGVSDKSSLKNITNLKSDTMPTVNGEDLFWNTAETDIYYQGNSDKTPPVTAEISYTLDKKPITAKELQGKSGKVEITVKLKNNEKTDTVIGGKNRTVYTPFAAAVVCDFANNTFSNICAEESSILTEGTNQVVSFISFPGLEENFDGILNDELKDLKSHLKDTFTITADVKDFAMPQIIIAAATNLGDLKNVSTIPEFDTLFDGLDKLKAATDSLTQGTDLLSQAAAQFDEKMGVFQDSYQTFDDGLVQACAGAQDLSAGISKLDTAAAVLKTEVSTELVPALQQSAPLQQQLSDKMAVLKKQLSQLKLPDMSAVQAQLTVAINTVCDASSDATIQITTGKTYNDLSPMQQAMLTAAKNQIKQEAGKQIGTMMAGIDMNALAQLKSTLMEIDGLSQQMMGAVTALTSALYSPSDDLNNPQTLAGAIVALSVGADKLDSGAKTYTSGLGQLSGASSTIADAIYQFKNATGALSEKAGELNQGMDAYANQGISKIADTKLIDDIKTAVEIKDQMQKQADAYNTYTGAVGSMSSKVRFVMKTHEIEKQQVVQPTESQTTEKVGFWQRVANLFKGIFSK